MRTLNEQEIFVDALQEVETELFKLSEQLGLYDELGKAWYIVYKRLQKEIQIEAKMKSEN